MDNSTVFLIILVFFNWMVLLTGILIFISFLNYKLYMYNNKNKRIETACAFLMGFACNIFFPLLKPLGSSTGVNDVQRRRANVMVNTTASPTANRPTSGDNRERVASYSAVVEPQELSQFMEMLSSIGTSVDPLTRFERPRESA